MFLRQLIACKNIADFQEALFSKWEEIEDQLNANGMRNGHELEEAVIKQFTSELNVQGNEALYLAHIETFLYRLEVLSEKTQRKRPNEKSLIHTFLTIFVSERYNAEFDFWDEKKFKKIMRIYSFLNANLELDEELTDELIDKAATYEKAKTETKEAKIKELTPEHKILVKKYLSYTKKQMEDVQKLKEKAGLPQTCYFRWLQEEISKGMAVISRRIDELNLTDPKTTEIRQEVDYLESVLGKDGNSGLGKLKNIVDEKFAARKTTVADLTKVINDFNSFVIDPLNIKDREKNKNNDFWDDLKRWSCSVADKIKGAIGLGRVSSEGVVYNSVSAIRNTIWRTRDDFTKDTIMSSKDLKQKIFGKPR